VAEGALGIAWRHATGPVHFSSVSWGVPWDASWGGTLSGSLALPVQGQAENRDDRYDGQPAEPTPRRPPPVVHRCRNPFHDPLAVRFQVSSSR